VRGVVCARAARARPRRRRRLAAVGAAAALAPAPVTGSSSRRDPLCRDEVCARLWAQVCNDPSTVRHDMVERVRNPVGGHS